MPSVKNPNTISRNRLASRAGKIRKQTQKRSASAGVPKSDTKRGARTGLLPTSGPRAPLSAKKQRKVERRLAHALKRKMAAEGEVEMKDAATVETSEKKKAALKEQEQMEIS